MFKEEYIKQVDSFLLREDFKAETVALLQQKQAEKEQNSTAFNKKANPFKPMYKFAAAAAVVLCCAAAVYYTHSSTSEITCYTLADALPIQEIEAEFTVKAQYDTSGSFGYEGLLLKDINSYDNGNPFSVNDSFETLPLYTFTPLAVEQLQEETKQLLNAFNADCETAQTEITFMELIYQDGHMVTQRPFTVDINDKTVNINDICRGFGVFYSCETQFEGGSIYVDIPRGQSRIIVDTKAQPKSTSEVISSLEESYTALPWLCDAAVYAAIDYNIYGEENPTYYICSTEGDYAQNIFNHSVNSTRVHYSPKEESLEEENQFVLWVKNNCYTQGKQLPAINWQQALGLLYEGEYYSSVPYEITEESAVSRIELVYKEAPYNQMTLTNGTTALPFYKFYVEIEEMNIPEKGLTDYGIYYVCAIHPSCIEITENYAQFN